MLCYGCNLIGIWGRPLWGERPASTDELDALRISEKVRCMRDDGTSLCSYGYGGQIPIAPLYTFWKNV